MSFKINFDTSGKVPSPSQSYYETTSRFQTILSTKLGTNYANNASNTIKGIQSSIDLGDLTKASNVSAGEINTALEGTAMAGLGNSFVEAEQKYGVNAWFLVGLAAHESAYGTSRIAQSKQNLFGFQAYDSSPYASAKRFDSFEESIDAVASYLKENYLTENGKYYNGLGIDAVNKRYATDQNWANAIASNINNMIGA